MFNDLTWFSSKKKKTKKQVSETIGDLWPIALYNIVFKNISKIITNRMKNVLGNVVSKSQSNFVLNKLIMDNILVASEVEKLS